MIDLALRDRLDRYEDALQSIVQWSEAYPLDIFPRTGLESCPQASGSRRHLTR